MRLREQIIPGPEEVRIGQTIGTYRIVREIGRGGMGVVYEAVHESIGQRAAVKVLSAQLSSQPKFGGRLLNEARAISMVRHAGLVNIFDFNQLPGGTVFIMMEYLEGESLWQRYTRLQQEGAWISLGETVQIARQIASTLAAVHRKSIVHRDLKPENIMLVDDPDMPLGERAKLLDFGIAKLRTSMTEESVRRTDAGIVLGTPLYMSPEQFLEEELDGQSDVYSLGAMIYEMVARKPPFSGRKWGELALKHLHEPPVALRQLPVPVPEALDVLVMEMLAKDLHERPVMAQVVDRLDELAEFMRTGRLSRRTDPDRPAVADTEICVKLEPEEVSARLEGVDALPSRPAVPSLFDRMPPHLATPALPARSSVGKAALGARNEARTMRWVTLALGLVTGAFLMSMYLLADRPAPRAHADQMVPAATTTTLPSATPPPAAPGLAAESVQAPPSQSKPPHPRRGLVLRFARRR
jgi:serine/threonine-protein kinase